ncbi:TPA: hypothetical protein ACH3X2_013780 [Trebouxia sp. C0005]
MRCTAVVAAFVVLAASHLASGAFSPEPEQSYSSSVCNSATNTTDNFNSDFVATLRNGSDGSDIGALENLVNFENAGQLLANASTAINLTEAKTILGTMQKQLSADISASSSAFAILANSINFTAIEQILTSLDSNMSSSDFGNVGDQLYSAVDTTGVGYFLGNWTMNNDLSVYGSLLNQMIKTVDFTQVGTMVGALPSLLTSWPQAGAILGQIAETANFTRSGDVLNGYIGSISTLLSGCGD